MERRSLNSFLRHMFLSHSSLRRHFDLDCLPAAKEYESCTYSLEALYSEVFAAGRAVTVTLCSLAFNPIKVKLPQIQGDHYPSNQAANCQQDLSAGMGILVETTVTAPGVVAILSVPPDERDVLSRKSRIADRARLLQNPSYTELGLARIPSSPTAPPGGLAPCRLAVPV